MQRWRKWFSVAILSAALSVGIISGQTVCANAAYKPYDRTDNLSPDEQFPSVGSSSEKTVSKKAWQKIDGVCYNGSGKKIEGAITRGMDVSEWQGKINWQEASEDLDFAFVRISYGASRIDYRYEYNMTEAEAADVPVGTYVYSLAKSNKEALAEAQTAIRMMQGHKVSYPVAFDLEDESTLGRLSKKEISQIALTFCDEIRKAGYTPILYMNLNWYNNHIDWSVLEGSGLDVWIACYGDTILAPSTSKYRYTIWQSTAGDEVPSMNSTKKLISGVPVENNVDLNFGFVDYTTRIVPRWNSQEDYIPATQPLYADPKPSKNGWATENGKKYYYVDGEKVTGWKEIGGKHYYFSANGGQLCTSKLIKLDSGAYYVNKYGVRVTNAFVTRKGKTYYLGADGKAWKGMHRISGKYYYFDPETYAMAKNFKHVTAKGVVYYFDSKGVRVKNTFVTISENGKKNVYYFGRTGKAYKGWHTIKGKKYYFYSGSCVRARSVSLTDSKGITSVFNKYGVCTKQYKAE